jgi:hypothetical protein
MADSSSTSEQPIAGQQPSGDTLGRAGVPAAFLGKWSGTAYPAGGVQAEIDVTIVQGKVGETIEHSAVTYTYINTLCTGQGVLVSASSQEIVVTSSGSSVNSMCIGLEGTTPLQVTYHLNTSGTLQASIDTGTGTSTSTSTAELTKQS